MKNLYLLGALIMCLIGNAQCLTNGDFELGVTANYTFTTNTAQSEQAQFSISGCSGNIGTFETFTMSPLVNQFNFAGGTLVDSSSMPGYGPFDETMFNLGTFIYRVSPFTGGTRAMKLNNSIPGSADINRMSVQINNAPQSIMFDYSVITQIHQDPQDPPNPDVEPFFSARLYNATTGAIIPGEFCFKANQTANFITTFDGHHQYTDWQCGSLTVPAAHQGQNLRLEFVMTDCGQGGHFGTVYLDNIRCGTTCTIFGKIALDEILKRCPDTPFQVCGSFINPTNAAIVNSSITLHVLDSNGVSTQLPLTATVTGTTFCFTVNPQIFNQNLSEQYEFRVSANFQGPAGTSTLWGVSTSQNADVSFDPLTPSLNSHVDQYDNLIWDDVSDEYTLEFRADLVCCVDQTNAGSVQDPEAYYSITTTDNFINIVTVTNNLKSPRCFRWRIRTNCGWSGWCCLTAPHGGITNFFNYLAPACYDGEDLCDDTITVPTVTNQYATVGPGNQLALYKEISIIASNTIENTGLGLYAAGRFIELKPSFKANSGSVFTAIIDECIGEDTTGLNTSSRTNMYNERMAITPTNNSVQESFVVYPNPTKGLVNITNKSAEVFTVIDINGKVVMRAENKDKTKDFSIDLSPLNRGIYFLTADGETIQKIIKE